MAPETGPERAFELDELFFSRTDRKGIILSSNEVFDRVAGYAKHDLVGKNHNVIRHPDTPRCVFELLWQTLPRGLPFAGYIKNRASDGSHYWVMAMVTSVEGGYLSVRLKPTSELFDITRSVYAAAKDAELAAGDTDPRRRRDAIEAGMQSVVRSLADAGFGSYDDFRRTALAAEVSARETTLAEEPRHAPAQVANEKLAMIARASALTHDELGQRVRALERFDSLAENTQVIRALAREIPLFSLNARLAAHRLGEQAAGVGVVARLVHERGVEIIPVVDDLAAQIAAGRSLLADLAFHMTASKLQSEMMVAFTVELFERDEIPDEHRDDLAALALSVASSVDGVLSSLAEMEAIAERVAAAGDELHPRLRALRALEINGRVEAAGLEQARSFAQSFTRIGRQIREATACLPQFRQMKAAARRDPAAEERLRAYAASASARVEDIADAIN